MIPDTSAKEISSTTLTNREKQVLTLLAQGLNQIQVAERVHLSHHTVGYHVRNILEKFAATNTTAAVAIALSFNLIKLSLTTDDETTTYHRPRRNDRYTF